jgi:hypothetical protein
MSYQDASSCYRKLEGLPEAFTGKPTSKEKLALATSGFTWLYMDDRKLEQEVETSGWFTSNIRGGETGTHVWFFHTEVF